MTLQVGVKIFLKNPEGKYLLMRRNPEKYPHVKDARDIVGGRIDPGSVLIANLEREVFEETQLKITSTPRLVYAQDIIPNDEKHVVRLSYVGETTGEPTLDTSENIEYKWLTVDEMKHQENLDRYVSEVLESDVI